MGMKGLRFRAWVTGFQSLQGLEFSGIMGIKGLKFRVWVCSLVLRVKSWYYA